MITNHSDDQISRNQDLFKNYLKSISFSNSEYQLIGDNIK